MKRNHPVLKIDSTMFSFFSKLKFEIAFGEENGKKIK
jgi:hypothetical protein